MKKPQVSRHEARLEDRFGDVREAGRKGAEARENNWHERLSLHREELEKHAPVAIAEIGSVLAGGATPSEKLKAAQLVLDRIGLGPHSSQDVNVETKSLVEQWAEELEALPPIGDQGDGA